MLVDLGDQASRAAFAAMRPIARFSGAARRGAGSVGAGIERDRAAAPAPFYATRVMPFEAHNNVATQFGRLMARPSFARVVEDARPYRGLSPQ